MKKERNTSIELLRIIAMLMVIAHHWEIHAYGDGICNSDISINQIFSFVIGSWGSLGVDIFFAISAYYLYTLDKELNFKKIINLIIKVSIYGSVVLFVANIINIVEFNIVETIKMILGVFAYQYWFISVYVVICVLSPALNKAINSLNKKYLFIIIGVLAYCGFVLKFFFYGNDFTGRLICGIVIYMIIGILERFSYNHIFEKYGGVGSVLSITIIICLEILCSLIGTYINPSVYPMIRRIQITQSPFMLLTALFIFYYFIKKKSKPINAINILGKYSVGGYLLHGGASFIRDYLYDGLCNAGYYYAQSFSVYVFHYFLYIIVLFFLGIISEFIYTHTIEVGIYKILGKTNL